MRVSSYLIGCSLVAALGGLLFGFDCAVISGTTDWLRAGFVAQITASLYPHVTFVSRPDLLEFMLGFTVASALIGTVIGSIIVGGRPMHWAAARCCSSWPSSTWSPPSDALWRGTGGRLPSRGYSADWR